MVEVDVDAIMETRKLYLEDGHLYAFEIDNIYISIRKATEVLSSINSVSDMRVRKPFNRESSDVHIRFKYLDKEYILLEPYGDSSEYWVGPDKEEDSLNIDIAPLESAFTNYKPSLLVKLIGDLITFKFLKRKN